MADASFINPPHYHAVMVNAGVEARLPAVASREIAIEMLEVWGGRLIDRILLADLQSNNRTIRGRPTIEYIYIVDPCSCPEEPMTQEMVAKNLKKFIQFVQEAKEESC